MKTFEVNKAYYCRSTCDHNCIWTFTVASRTAKTIRTTEGKTLRIHAELTAMNGAETVFPLGRYSMAPILTADKIAA